MKTPIAPSSITGLVLAGGRGTRMGGVDKGLQAFEGQPLAAHALARLRAQVGTVALNANRHHDQYARFGAPVWPDPLPDFPGPLAGLLAGLRHSATEWVVTVPCDSPRFPADLVARLAAAAAAAGAELAVAATPAPEQPRWQPVFMLARCRLADDLQAWIEAGERKVDRWIARHPHAVVVFDDAPAFANANTPEELAALTRG